MWSVFTINQIAVPEPSQSRCGRGFPRLTRLSLQSFSPDSFCRAESRINHDWQGFQRLTRPSLQSFENGFQMQFVRLFYCVKIAFYGWFLRKGDDFDGTAADIGDQDGAHASVPFVFYADHDTRESSPTSPVPIGSYGPAGMAGCHNSFDGF
jgi:hypothetical protein